MDDRSPSPDWVSRLGWERRTQAAYEINRDLIRSTSREELAWAAGFFDGEGHIACRWNQATRERRYLRLDVQITQIDPEVLFRFREAMGGLGQVGGPYSARNRPNDAYRYLAAGFPVVAAIAEVLSEWCSSPKRKQAEEALLRYLGR